MTMILESLKNRAVGLLGIPAIGRLVAARANCQVVLVMLHRFTTEGGVHLGADPRQLRRTLVELRSAGVELVSADQAVRDWDSSLEIRAGNSAKKAPRVAFTIDDGYADALEVAGPIFAEFDCPATCFVVPEVVEQREWFWWDKIDTLLRATDLRRLIVSFDGHNQSLGLGDAAARRYAFDVLCEWTKRLPTAAVPEFLEQVGSALNAQMPNKAPDEYRVLTWDEMRSAERRGWRFGAHTMTHPVVGRCDDQRAEWEIGASLAALRNQVSNPSDLFCYPVGRDGDFGVREFDILRRHGVKWALSAVPGCMPSPKQVDSDPTWRLRLPRFSADERRGGVLRMFLN